MIPFGKIVSALREYAVMQHIVKELAEEVKELRAENKDMRDTHAETRERLARVEARHEPTYDKIQAFEQRSSAERGPGDQGTAMDESRRRDEAIAAELKNLREQEAEKRLLYEGARDPTKFTPNEKFIRQNLGPMLSEQEIQKQAEERVEARFEGGDQKREEGPRMGTAGVDRQPISKFMQPPPKVPPPPPPPPPPRGPDSQTHGRGR